MTSLSTHVLNTATGLPAAEVKVELVELSGTESATAEMSRELTQAATNDDGRHRFDEKLQEGTYRLRFQTGDYFSAQGTKGLYPWADIVFTVSASDEHLHVPLLLSPFGYSTYRGS